MATASPTPFGLNYDGFPRRAPSRQNVRTQALRPHLKRGSPLSVVQTNNDGPLPEAWKFSIGDSSDDDVPVPPMKFSAEAKAILGDEASVIGSSPAQRNGAVNDRTSKEEPPLIPASESFRATWRERHGSPASTRSGSPRIVRLGGGVATARRNSPISIKQDDRDGRYPHDLITPAPRPRNLQTRHGTTGSGNASSESNNGTAGEHKSAPGEARADSKSEPRGEGSGLQEAAAQMDNLSINRSKAEETGVQGSLRVKRVGKVTGRYLSGPARRGMKRRQSEEDQSPIQEDVLSSGEALHEPAKQEEEAAEKQSKTSPPPTSEPAARPPLVHDHVHFRSQASIITESPIPNDERLPKPLEPLVQNNAKTAVAPVPRRDRSSDKIAPAFKVPPLPPLPSRFDQENEPPPTFKRNKPDGRALAERPQKSTMMADEKMLINTPATISPLRPALAARSQNTPLRPAPPPPKMTVLETATATAGAASASQLKKKRNYISVNGKLFTRMDCIGRGGSSKVYRVMAENFKVFALKRVTLEDQDEAAIRGYKGEIDLLKKLENVDRVIRLFDWEVNEERHTLSVLMEMGESDLNRVLGQRLNAEDATFDVTFTRYYWKEMLECVQAVHQHDIVHSDLKPANFLLLQGKLKLIDFGISNAIQDDTVNVHREQHIGTPNYMSPEALVDSNASAGLPSSVGKMMKLGKPSDVWSLGCILYQMVYGKPPFAHIPNQMQRIMAIPNPKHIIAFPPHGVGGVPVSTGLVKTLRRCLNRDAKQRPTVDELLSHDDMFLNPDQVTKGTVPVSQEMLARIQQNIVNHIKRDGMPSEEELRTWPGLFFASIKAAVEEGRA